MRTPATKRFNAIACCGDRIADSGKKHIVDGNTPRLKQLGHDAGSLKSTFKFHVYNV